MHKVSNRDLGRPTADQYRAQKKLPVMVVLDHVRSLNNIGSVFRTCDAFCIQEIYLCGISAVPPNKEIHKTALGAENTVPWRYAEKTAEALGILRSEGYRLLAVEQVKEAVMLDAFRVGEGVKYALVFGNEVSGVSDEVLGLCDGAIEIPQSGTKHSLNVSVAAGVVLWHFFQSFLEKDKECR